MDPETVLRLDTVRRDVSGTHRCVFVASSKGGVGKSMVAANLAYALKDRGLRVGLLDADVDSPYLVEIVGVKGRVDLTADRLMVPVQHDGMPIMSFALWVPDGFTGASMSGDMHARWVTDALTRTEWGDIDVLVVDLPAGLGDEYLTVARIEPARSLGLVVVALPNVTSGLLRVYETASYHHLRILGVVENMGGDVFGSGPVEACCRTVGLKFFGTIPLDARIRRAHEAHDPRIPTDLRAPIEAACDMVAQKAVA